MHPVFKRIDTCAAEFASPTPYMYSTYETPFAGAAAMRGRPSRPAQGHHPRRRPEPHRPGHRVRLLLLPRLLRAAEAGFETIMVNCNPETVSTDYDTSDRLYFEPLTAEDVLEIVRVEQAERRAAQGVIVQFGGQTPLKLAAGARARPASRSSAPRPTPSTSPRTASASRRCSTGSGCAAGERHRPLGERGARDRRRARLPAGHPAVLRARRPRHGDRPRRRRSSTATSPRPWRSPATARC